MNMKKSSILIFLIFISGCSISPGMHMESRSSWLNDSQYVYIESIEKNVKLISISEALESSYKSNYIYKIGVGDQISITVWGLPETFPITNISPDQNLRRVDANGNIFFPFAGLVEAKGRTQDELRNDITIRLAEYFNDPQIDVTIARFNSQKLFVLGEVKRPIKINIKDIPISLSMAIGESFGLNNNTAEASEVFIIRQNKTGLDPLIFHANLKNPSNFIEANNFYLQNNDIVYVNASGTTRWNKIISQFFPFSSFLNSIDNLSD